ncbi:EKC/KEOPS complex subunit GON7 [Lachancea thermotolerans]|uniref:EKC/KEOPS complex subunit GON7 n=1 Tax=Lachancea thermotolerans (strain ATCC 56472 / CBS 6340 / NRRL Y-8284) TaxID=559295 RepID=C5DKF1_LACTC|nr:KLTH0F04158p [Lachancea thermotolerans CBS 6340]CAR23952.1 KLTH0F04158p [Lachancea thermotolerans CBS 6340]
MPSPFAIYKSPNSEPREFRVDPARDRYNTTNGTTTGPSAYVLQAGQVDRDKPSEPKCNEQGEFTELSILRMALTGLQDDINEYLTQQMEVAKNKKLKQDDEQRISGEINKLLDGGDDDDDDDDDQGSSSKKA